MVKVLAVVGTRPEAIKMAPVVHACHRHADEIDLLLCSTGQHRHLLDDALAYFEIEAQARLDVMRANESLSQLTARCLKGVDELLEAYRPDCVVAQGDTISAMAVSMAAFFRQVPLVHVEAGLRTGDLDAPWPEEFNRRVATLAAALHCAPSRRAAENVIDEGVPSRQVHVVGNTVVDALLWTRRRETNGRKWETAYRSLEQAPLILVTSHRRENFGRPLENLCRAIGTLAEQYAQVHFICPMHRNPQARVPFVERLSGRANIHLCEALPYPEFVWLMDRSTLIITDSGGIQEEAPSLGTPVLVVRETSERDEVISSGAARLIGTDWKAIVWEVARLLDSEAHRATFRRATNPYGDGHAGERIVRLLSRRAWMQTQSSRADAGDSPIDTDQTYRGVFRASSMR